MTFVYMCMLLSSEENAGCKAAKFRRNVLPNLYLCIGKPYLGFWYYIFALKILSDFLAFFSRFGEIYIIKINPDWIFKSK